MAYSLTVNTAATASSSDDYCKQSIKHSPTTTVWDEWTGVGQIGALSICGHAQQFQPKGILMANFYAAAMSPILKNNNITFTGNAASTPSTTFASQSRQILVISTLAYWFRYGAAAQTAVANTDVYVPANVPLTFMVTP